MSEGVKQTDEPVAGADSAARPGPTSAEESSSAGETAAGVVRVFAGGGDGLPTLRRLAAVQQHQTVLALQRTHGNAAVQRLLTRDRPTAVRRHAATELTEPENAIRRHTSVT